MKRSLFIKGVYHCILYGDVKGVSKSKGQI